MVHYFYRNMILLVLALFFLCGCGNLGSAPSPDNDLIEKSILKEIPVLQSLSKKWISSAYFERGMGYKGARFKVVSFSDLVLESKVKGGTDAVLLDCRDDYQGVVSVEDIHKYNLKLAINIDLKTSKKPSWLNPLLIIVPDGVNAPLQERFMAANINRLNFISLKEYYGPIEKVALSSNNAQSGKEMFFDNCLFCHSINGVGGNKGARLLKEYKYSNKEGYEKFRKDFINRHNDLRPEKRDMKNFKNQDEALNAIFSFLAEAANFNL